MLEKNDIIVGTGSACSSKNPFSRVLKEAGHDNKTLDGVVRISFSYDTTIEDVLVAVEKLNENALNLKKAMYNL